MYDIINVKVDEKDRPEYLGKSYVIETHGSMLVGDVSLNGTMKKEILDRAIEQAKRELSQQISVDVLKEAKKLYGAEVKENTRAYIRDNKDKLINDLTTKAIQDIKSRLREELTDYE